MKTIILTAFALLFQSVVSAQISKPFIGKMTNKALNIYLNINLYDKNIIVPSQEVFGETEGYIGDNKDSRKWIIVSSEIRDNNTATLQIINDYGSEDLTANLKCINDSLYILEQISGSKIKIARNKKWQKLPDRIEFNKSKQ